VKAMRRRIAIPGAWQDTFRFVLGWEIVGRFCETPGLAPIGMASDTDALQIWIY
jgi:hypothetical protein